jgi:hypothetical protein
MNRKTILLSILVIALLVLGASTAFANENRNFRTNLSGAEEVPPVET